jgi:hypothetical protein
MGAVGAICFATLAVLAICGVITLVRILLDR